MIKGVNVAGNEEVKASLKALGKDAPEAVRLSIAEYGETGQRAVKTSLPKHFKLRGTSSAFERAVIWRKPTVSSSKASGELAVGREGSNTATSRLGGMLARHEEEGARSSTDQVYFDSNGKAMTGLGFFLPAKGLRTDQANPPRSEYPTAIGVAMRLQKGRGGQGDRLILAKGTKKGSKATGNGATYFATPKGIFRRRHSGFGDSAPDLLWHFKRTVRTPARLRMWDTVNDALDRVGTGALERAIETVIKRSA